MSRQVLLIKSKETGFLTSQKNPVSDYSCVSFINVKYRLRLLLND